jgi:hypothetical protein
MSAQSPLFPVSDQTTDIAACLKQKATQYEFSGVRSALWVAREERRNDLRDLSDKLLMHGKLPRGIQTLRTPSIVASASISARDRGGV